jgi:hypothetical protein
MTLAPRDDLPYASERAALQAEIDRLGRFDLPVVDRQDLTRRLRAAVLDIEASSRRPEDFSWVHAWARTSTGSRIGLLASVLLATGVAVWRVAFIPRQSADEAQFTDANVFLAMMAALFVGMYAGEQFLDVAGRRRRLRGALRFAQRLRSGARRPRREARAETFVGPPAADLLTAGGVVLALVAGRNGFWVPAALGVALMSSFVAALARRVRIRLALPFNNRHGKQVLLTGLAAYIGLAYLADGADSAALRSLAATLFGVALFYFGCVLLVEERVPWRYDFVERDRQPVQYWLTVSLTLFIAFALLAAVALGMGRLSAE